MPKNTEQEFKPEVNDGIAVIDNSIEQQPNDYYFDEHTSADSSWYSKYNLRPYNPDDLFQKRGNYDLFDQMREDDQISAILALKKFIILNSDYEIDCEDETAKEFLEWNLCEGIDELFTKKLYLILSAIDYGYSLTEKIYSLMDTEWGKKIVLTKMKTRAPHTFEFRTDKKGNVYAILQHTGTDGDILIDPKKFIHYPYNSEFDNPYGRSDLNSGVYRAYWSKDAIIKFWNIYLERFGMPTAVGKMSPEAGSGDKDRFKKVLENIQAKTSIVIPKEFEVEFLESTRGGEKSFETAIDKYNMMIARKMLIPDLMGMSGSETAGGSYALGKEQFTIFYTTIEYERNNMKRMINRDIIAPLVLWNFGSSVKAEFRWKPIDADKKNNAMKLWIEALKTGKLPVTKNHINWFLGLNEIPEISDEEYDEIENRKSAMLESLKPNEYEGDAGSETDKSDVQSEDDIEDSSDGDSMDSAGTGGDSVAGDDDSERDKERDSDKEYVEQTAADKMVDYAAMERALDGLEDRYKIELEAQFKLSINAMVDDIKKKKIIENRRIDQVNKVELKYQTQIKTLIKKMLFDAWKVGDESVAMVKNHAVLDADVVETMTDAELEKVLYELSVIITGVEAEAVKQRVKFILMDGIRNGSSVKDMMKNVEGALSGYDFATNGSRVENIVRTNVMKVYNEARKRAFEKGGDRLIGYQYSAVMDSRTTPLCQKLHGKKFPPADAAKYNPPNHFMCRSVLLPIYKGEEFDGYDKLPAMQEQDGYDGFYTLAKE